MPTGQPMTATVPTLTELKSCPFCGGAPIERWCGGVYLVECSQCFVSKGDGGADTDIEESARANWNRRASRSGGAVFHRGHLHTLTKAIHRAEDEDCSGEVGDLREVLAVIEALAASGGR